MKKEFSLGILLVHGIGAQRSGETLVKWGDALVNTLRKATRGKVSVSVVGSFTEEEKKNAEVVLKIDSNEGDEKWLVSEGYWADSFIPPSYFELVSWSIRAIPWAITLYVAQQHWQGQEKRNLEEPVRWILTVFKLCIALILAPVFIAFLAITLILGILPIPQLRSFFLTAQSTLVANVGDSLAFVESPVRAALIRSAILKKLISLKPRCEKTIIVAHSQGAAVVLDALGGIDESLIVKGDSGIVRRQMEIPPVPDTLITFGSGVNQLANLKLLATKSSDLHKNNNAWLGIGVVLGIPLVLAWLFIVASVSQIVFNFATIAIGVLSLLLFSWIMLKIGRILEKYYKVNPKTLYRIQVTTIAFFFIALIFSMIRYGEQNGSIYPAFLLLFLIILFIGYSRNLLSKDFQEHSTIVKRPEGLSRWIDIYASADPVPNGETRSNDPEELCPKKIHNLSSFIFDHTSYWANQDGFILRVLKYCGLTSGSPWLGRLAVDSEVIEERAVWRLWLLNISNYITFFICSLMAYTLWPDYGSEWANNSKMLEWLPFSHLSIFPLFSWVLVSLLVVYILCAMVKMVWQWWVSKDQDAFFNGEYSAMKEDMANTVVNKVKMEWVIQLIISYIVLILFFGILAITRSIDYLLQFIDPFKIVMILFWAALIGGLIKKTVLKVFPIPKYSLDKTQDNSASESFSNITAYKK